MTSDAYNLRLYNDHCLKFCPIINNSMCLLNGSNRSHFKGFNIVYLIIINSANQIRTNKKNDVLRQKKK